MKIQMIWNGGRSLLRCTIQSQRCLSQAQILGIWRQETRVEENGWEEKKRAAPTYALELLGFILLPAEHEAPGNHDLCSSMPLPMLWGSLCHIWRELWSSSKRLPLARQRIGLSVGTKAHDDDEEESAQTPEVVRSAASPLLEGPSQRLRWILCLGTGKIWIYVHKQMHEAKGADKT